MLAILYALFLLSISGVLFLSWAFGRRYMYCFYGAMGVLLVGAVAAFMDWAVEWLAFGWLASILFLAGCMTYVRYPKTRKQNVILLTTLVLTLLPYIDVCLANQAHRHRFWYWPARHYWRYYPASIEHFPATIPSGAQDVRMYFEPGAFLWMLEWEIFQLEYTLPAEEIEELYRYYRDECEVMYMADKGGRCLMKFGYQLGDVPRQGELPGNYTVMLLGWSKNDDEHEEIAYGVAICKETNRILYWAVSD